MFDNSNIQAPKNPNETTDQDTNENLLDLSIVIDELHNLISKETSEGKEERVIKQHVLNYINSHKIILQEIYNWLLNNQNHLNSIYLLGYFNYHGIGTNINMQNAFELYQKVAELGNNVAQFNLANMFIDGKGVDKNYDKAFELSNKLAEKNFSNGINLLGYCHDYGIGTSVDNKMAFELYQKAADLGNSVAQSNLALMYRYGEVVDKNNNKAF